MTKTEFKTQFKRFRMAGYRLPVFDGVTVDNIMDEWYDTFEHCTVQEFGAAIDRLKQVKTDTFWPATGEIWFYIFEYRKRNAIRRQSEGHGGDWSMSDADAQEFLAMLRATRDKILGKMTMPHAEAQVAPDHVLLEQEDREREG